MTITNIEVRPRVGGRQHVDFLLDGEPWAHGSVPGDLNEAGVLAFLESQADAMRCHRYRNTYPTATVTPGDGESLLQAWQRVIALGMDDAEEPLQAAE